MKIKILNKNNSREYEVDEAPVFTECYNETLDSGTVVVSNQTERIELQPYDIVAIYRNDDSFWKYMCVDTYVETMTCVNPKVYRYEISLFSETKQLEGIVLPNLKITKVFGQSRSIFHYINQYMNEYSLKIREYSPTDNYTYSHKFSWDTEENRNKFNLECPEMQWNTPTLREVLNDLMMVADCIPVLKNSHLMFLDLTQTNGKNWLDDNHINYITKSRSSEDYVSELQVKLENITNKDSASDNIVTKVEYCHLNIPDTEAVLTTQNILLKTQYPIYNLKSVQIMFPAEGILESSSPGSSSVYVKKWMSADLMNLEDYNEPNFNLVYEYQNWITKPVKYNSTPPTKFSDWAKYQNYTLYYRRGTNEICNLGNTGKWTIIFPGTWVLYTELTARIMKYYSPLWEDYGLGFDSYRTPKWYNLFFKVEYETLEGCLFRASKGDNPDNNRVVIDNQTNSMVDSYSQGFLEYQKANRLGNEQLQINARFNQNDTLISIADTYEDSIIYQCQYQYFKNHTEVNATATKNYVLREYFTGVKSKIRSWRIASGSEALTRHDLLKYYCEFSWRKHAENSSTVNLPTDSLVNYFLSPLESYSAEPLKCCFVRTIDSESNTHPSNYPNSEKSYYCLDLMNRIVGNSLVLTFEFPDNYWAGQSYHTEADFDGETPESGDKYIEFSDIQWDPNGTLVYILDSSALSGGGVPMYQHRYTDNNGEFTSGSVVFASSVKLIPGSTYDDIKPGDNLSASPYTKDKTFMYLLYQRPRVSEQSIKDTDVYDYERISTFFNISKDSQEIFNLSTQFEFCTDTTDICIGKEFLKRQQAINPDDNGTSEYLVSVYDKSAYNFRDPNHFPQIGFIKNCSFKSLITDSLDSNLNSQVSIALIDSEYACSTEAEARELAENIAKDCCLYINDGNVNPLLNLNNIPLSNCTHMNVDGSYYPAFNFYLNILKTRNKNIYDSENHYLIVDKI